MLFRSGMLLSNEPGYYLPGAYGIRLENLVMAQPADFPEAKKPFLRFETVTWAPFDRRLLAPWLMRHTRAELEALALQHNLILAPLRRFDEVLATPQFAHRQFIGSVQVAGRSLLWPGLPFRMLAERTESAIDQAASMLFAGGITPLSIDAAGGTSGARSLNLKFEIFPEKVTDTDLMFFCRQIHADRKSTRLNSSHT